MFLWALFAVGLALLLRFWLPASQMLLESVELRSVDARFLLRGPHEPKTMEEMARQVAIVSLDDAATGRFGRVLPRAVHGRLVRRLKAAGARAVIFDVIFADPSFLGAQDDAEFAAACAAAKNVFLPFDDNSSHATPAALETRIKKKLAYRLPAIGAAQDKASLHIQPPWTPLFQAMRGGGHVATKADIDGKFRSAILLLQVGDSLQNTAIYPHVALDAVARAVWGINATEQEISWQGNWLQIGSHRLGPLEKRRLTRTDADGETEAAGLGYMIPLDFLGEHRDLTRLMVPYLDALEGRADERLRGRVVIVGETATGTPDLRPGPFDGHEITLGVETNATLIANLLESQFLQTTPRVWAWLVTAIIGLIAALAVALLRPWKAFVLTLSVLALYDFGAAWIFVQENLVLELTGPFVSAALGFGVLNAFRLMFTERERREYETALLESRALLGQSIGSSVAQQLSLDPAMRAEMRIGARREATVLFSDIRGFTAWSETQNPEEVKARLDEYFPVMCEIAEEDYGGFIDKFVGDELMVVWSVPYDQEDHAARAVRAALSMQRALEMLNDGWKKQKQQPFHIGIGIASGSVVFGTFGSVRHKLQPTVLGDTVNFASRLQEATKETGAKIIIAQTTYEQLGDEFETRSLGAVPVRGKSEVQVMYEVLGKKRDATTPA